MPKNKAVLSKSAHEYLTYLDVLKSANVTTGNKSCDLPGKIRNVSYKSQKAARW